MKKINMKLLFLTSLLIFLPILLGISLWEELPDRLPTHFGFDGQANGYSSKVEAVFLLPFILLGVHIFAVVLTSKDPKAKNVAAKMRLLIYWLVPCINIFVQLTIYGFTYGFISNLAQVIFVFLAFLLIVLGNYLPKVRQNYTVGIRLPWTLDDEGNWYKTHRLAGKVWTVNGLILLIASAFPIFLPYIFGIVLVLIVFIPTVYSNRLSRLK